MTPEQIEALLSDETHIFNLSQTEIQSHHPLCALAREAGHATVTSCLNDGNLWGWTVSEVAGLLLPSPAPAKNAVTLTLLGDGVRIDDNEFDGHYSYQAFASVLAEYEPSTVQELWDLLEENC